MSITLSLNEIRAHNPCASGWGKALKALGKTQADDTRVTFAWIIETNGPDDALWALRCLPESEQWRARLFARWCALGVIHLWPAPQVVRDYLSGGGESLRAAAGTAAWDAARDAAGAAARDAAWDAARDAAGAAQKAKLIEIMELDHVVTTLVIPERPAAIAEAKGGAK